MLYQDAEETAMTTRTQLKAGKIILNHSEALQVRSTLKAGGIWENHNEALLVRTALKAGGRYLNHNETLERAADRPIVSMRRQVITASRQEDRLALLVVRAGLRAGLRARARVRR
jgi:hypothetical protein